MPAAFYYRTSQAPAFPTFWVCGRKPHRLGNADRASALFRATVGYSADGPFIEGFTYSPARPALASTEAAQDLNYLTSSRLMM
jgi:hypothetical protein